MRKLKISKNDNKKVRKKEKKDVNEKTDGKHVAMDPHAKAKSGAKKPVKSRSKSKSKTGKTVQPKKSFRTQEKQKSDIKKTLLKKSESGRDDVIKQKKMQKDDKRERLNAMRRVVAERQRNEEMYRKQISEKEANLDKLKKKREKDRGKEKGEKHRKEQKEKEKKHEKENERGKDANKRVKPSAYVELPLSSSDKSFKKMSKSHFVALEDLRHLTKPALKPPEKLPKGGSASVAFNLNEVLRIGGVLGRYGMDMKRREAFDWLASHPLEALNGTPQAVHNIRVAVGDLPLSKPLVTEVLQLLIKKGEITTQEYENHFFNLEHNIIDQLVTISQFAYFMNVNCEKYKNRSIVTYDASK